ncbi:MAG TPA: anhydro-N-acetylmuramic acid kinase [Oligoflexia bacterium]|nr:anhydro-N-acetylmuramic acid kinase [Oligoflexia bacterium]HMP48408.1 anhydro-N-acetylmuramic acid kinase [Oligoflexia bacterium]
MNKSERLVNVIKKDRRVIIGLMSGMSMDGIDLAMVEINGKFPDLDIKLLDDFYLPYSLEMKKELRQIVSGDFSSVSKMNFKVGKAFADAVNTFIRDRKIDPQSIDAIGSHGQTVFHETGSNVSTPSTLQIGSGSVIAELTGIITVHNFRERDIAAGGNAAPLVPLVDWLLFREKGSVVACNNLGSISNVTVVTQEIEGVFAFDTGPANMQADYFSSLVPGDTYGYDHDGLYSKKGKVLPELLNEFLKHPYFLLPPPKALGFQQFGAIATEKVIKGKCDNFLPEDLVMTAIEIAARTLVNAYTDFVLPKVPSLDKIYFSGGGAKNPTLMNRIRELLPDGVQALTLTDKNINYSDSKEALAFAVLAGELLSGRCGNIPSVTGASHACVLGDISI